ncbi:MAG: HD domain-containing protein, partial [Syntrophaceae bacterium]|nr:HD domain-containing protein [Syntrophaceae bacterium]
GSYTYPDHIKRLTEIGVALSAEKNINRLMEMILSEARAFTNAEGGTLYIMSDDESELLFTIIQNDSINVQMGGTHGAILWPSVKLKNDDGSPNHSNVSSHAAISGQAVNIEDVYSAKGFNFSGTKKFDRENGYRSKSMMVVPMRNHENEIIGVLQLINALDPITGEVISFSRQSQEMTLSLASQAAVVLTNNQLIHDLESLLESFIKTIATAIDEKSPYTGGHIRRVAQLTMAIAHKINKMKEGPFASVSFSVDQLKELRMAAWLHDIGKITTPEHLIDKAKKLETLNDRMNDIKTRIEVIKRDYLLKNRIAANNKRRAPDLKNIKIEIKALDEERRFLEQINSGMENIDDKDIARIKKIAKREWKQNSKTMPLLTKDEVYNLSIPYGTLNEKEKRTVINHAALTKKILSQLPFPKKMRRIAQYAAAHHEKLDGSGYPSGLKADKISLQSRIITIADIFEAITAKDRPYKKGKSATEAIKIMKDMVKDNYIDTNLFDLFVKEKIYNNYVNK